MTVNKTALFREADGLDPLPRVHVKPHGLKAATFKAESEGDTPILHLCPLVNVAGVYQQWEDADARVHALLWAPSGSLDLDATNQVVGVVMLAGQVSYLDIPLPAGQTQNTLAAALKAGMRELDIDIVDLQGADLPAADVD
jgi:hypothetical protein